MPTGAMQATATGGALLELQQRHPAARYICHTSGVAGSSLHNLLEIEGLMASEAQNFHAARAPSGAARLRSSGA